jgi:hypothetical protein
LKEIDVKSKVASAIWLGSFVALTAAVSPSASAQSQQQALFRREINVVHPIPTDPPAGLSHTDLAWYAWRLFAACNQGTAATLADGSTRETPSSTFLSTGAPGPLPNPTIFEALYHRTECYPYYTSPAPPSPVKQVPVYRFMPIQGSAFTVTGGQYVNLDETNQIGQNFIYYRQSNDKNFPILFMAKVNSTQVVYAQGNAANNFQPTTSTSWLFPPNGANNENTLEVKSAWRPVADVGPDASLYHQATVTWYEGLEGQVPTVKTGVFALIALHIIQKSANYPSFIFTTFEHVDAVTRNSQGVITDPAFQLTSPTLHYDGTTGPNPVTSFTGAYDINAPGQPPKNNQTTQNFVLPPQGPAPNANHPPSPIEAGNYKVAYQPQTINREVNDVNNLVGPMLGNSVWKNYRLKGVQGTPTNDQTTLDFFLANIVVETSEPGIQLFKGGVAGTGQAIFTNDRTEKNLSVGLVEKKPVPQPTYVMGGCMGCHGIAQTQIGTDFSFLPPTPLLSAGKAVDAVIPPGTTDELRSAAKKAIAIRRGYLLQPRK